MIIKLYYEDLVQRNGLYYQKFSDIPFTGKIESKITGTGYFIDGKRNGTWIYYHQNGHGGPPPIKMMNRWFTRYLHGIENGVENDPVAWIVRENDTQNNPTSYKGYPNPDASLISLHLDAGAPETGSLKLKKI